MIAVSNRVVSSSLFKSQAQAAVPLMIQYPSHRFIRCTTQLVLWSLICLFFHCFFLSIPSMTWVGQCRWPGLAMARGWVLRSSLFAPHMSLTQCCSFVTRVGRTWVDYSVNCMRVTEYSAARKLMDYIMSSSHQGLRHINKWSVPHFPQAEPCFLAGHPGFDNFSGALLHDQTWAVQTLPKVRLVISPARKSAWFVFDLHSSFDETICLPARTTGSHLRMWPASSTTPSSDPSLASPSAPRTLGK